MHIANDICKSRCDRDKYKLTLVIIMVISDTRILQSFTEVARGRFLYVSVELN